MLRSKTVTGTTHYYTLNGSQILTEQFGNIFIVYLYDESGSPIGMQYRTKSMAEGTFYTYLFEKNLQGDIIAVYNTSGTKLVSYVYDAWGNVTVTNHNVSGTNTGARYNPFRYRGYYYDTETGYYYLQSRYYNPEWGRFISPDSFDIIGATTDDLYDNNLYSYCDNNPVMRLDDSGDIWNWVIGAGVGAVAGFVGQIASDIVTSIINGEITISNWQTYTGAIVGGAVGGAILGGTGNISAANAATGFVTTGLGQTLEKLTIDGYDKSWTEIGVNAVADGTISYGLGKIPGINSITSGRNSMSAVYKSGLTKLRNETAKRMSSKVIGKGITSSIVSGFAMDSYYGVKQHAYDRTKKLLRRWF